MKRIAVFYLLFMAWNSYAQLTPRETRLLLLSSKPSVEQFRKGYPNACYIYKTAEDYYNNNPVAGKDWHPWKSDSRLEVTRNGITEKVKLSEFGDDWFSDENGFLMRNYEKDLYKVVVDGAVCYYVQFNYGEVYKNADGVYDFAPTMYNHKFFEFYSLTLKGEVKSWSDKVLENYLKEFGLLEQYKAEKIPREMKDGVWDVESRKINKKLKYLKIVNEKLSKK